MKVRNITALLGVLLLFSAGCNPNIDDQYLVRAAQSEFRGADLYVLDSKSREWVPLNDVQQLILLSTNGKRQAGSLITDASRAYHGPLAPADLEGRMRTDIAQMVAAGWIRLSGKPAALPHELIPTMQQR